MTADRRDDKTPPTPHQWSAEAKLAVVLETAAVPEAELGAFPRRKEPIDDRSCRRVRSTRRNLLKLHLSSFPIS